MNPLTSELQAVADDLTDAGVPATTDPAAVLPLVTAHGVAALVAPPDEIRPGLGLSSIDLDVVVTLVTAAPDDLDAADRLYTATLAAIPAAPPLEWVTRTSQRVGQVDLPALTWATPRRIPYPTPVRS